MDKTDRERLVQLVNCFRTCAKGVLKGNECRNALAIALLNIVESQAPDFYSNAERISNVYDEIIDFNIDYSTKLERAAEDINDILERQKVIDRLTKENEDALKEFYKQKQNLKKNMIDEKKEELKNQLRQMHTEILKQTAALLQKREMNTLFILNRFKHAFMQLSEGLQESKTREEIVFKTLSKNLDDLHTQAKTRINRT